MWVNSLYCLKGKAWSMKSFSLQKKMVFQIVLICTFLVGISALSHYYQKKVASSYRDISSNQFPKVESVSRLIANFRLIRIKVRTLGLTGNTEADQAKYINETKKVVGLFAEEKKKFVGMNFSKEEKPYVQKMEKEWKNFLNFGLDLLSKYENPTEQSLVEASNMIRKICPIKANAWMSVAQNFLKYQRKKTQNQVSASMNEEESILMFSSIGLFLSFVLSVALGFWFSKGISKKILFISNKLRESTVEVKKSSESMSVNSNQINQTAMTSSSSLQETASSMDEISAMIQRNADSADRSTEVSSKSSEVAQRGKKTVEQMITSVKEIATANDEIADEMLKSNEDISKIINVIKEISEKTNVINDIVFQTKLLSFNASVEAARAGEHGKGFAVVAEEVGNLATMSGQAASEISEMLEKSTEEVSSIVQNTKRKVEGLVASSKEKISTGNTTAHNCGDVLDEILHNVESVNEMVGEIATASKEQSEGVQVVTRSLQRLDESTHKNSAVAKESSSMAERLNNQAISLDDAVKDLVCVVNGGIQTFDQALESHEGPEVISFSDDDFEDKAA